jgi:hypothetical protein
VICLVTESADGNFSVDRVGMFVTAKTACGGGRRSNYYHLTPLWASLWIKVVVPTTIRYNRRPPLETAVDFAANSSWHRGFRGSKRAEAAG